MKKMIPILFAAVLLTALGLSALAAEPEPAPLLDVLCAPCGVAQTESGALLVTDGYNKCVWLVENGHAERYAGADSVHDRSGEPLGGYNDSTLEKSLFKEPWAISPFLDGWAVSDPDNRVVRLVRPDRVETINGHATERDITVGDMGVVFQRPTGLATDEKGNLYVADTDQGRIFRISPQGLVVTLRRDLNEPTGLCWHDGALYVAETGAHRIVKLVDGRVELVAGCGEDGYEDGPADKACFSWPSGVTVDENGVVYVADTVNGAVRRVANGKVDTLLRHEPGALELYPIAPRGLLISGGKLLACDPYARILIPIDLKK